MANIRPIIRSRGTAPTVFQSRVQGGAIHSQWVPEKSQIIPTGTPGRVGEVVDAINRGAGSIARDERPAWRPPPEYEFYAKKLGLGPAFIKRCEEWHAAHPPPKPVVKIEQFLDHEPVLRAMKKYSKKGPPTESGIPQPTRPPLHVMKVAWECAGYTQEQIELAVARLEYAESQLDVRQRALDAIFGEYPSASKPTPKAKAKKTIKAVKKKMSK
jgi:hypothetical protein